LAVWKTFPYFVSMMTVKQFAEKRGKPVATVYSWIDRGKAEKNGFKVVQIGNMKLIEEIKLKKITT
jgi:hypothetical protein